MKNYYLYYLIDPILDQPKYIGITCSPEKRLEYHLADTSNSKKCNWIRELKAKKVVPILKVQKTTHNIHEVISWEKEEIALHKEEWELVNSTEGGEYYGVGRAIDVYTLKGEFIKTYESISDFCLDNGKSKNFTMSVVCSCRKTKSYGGEWIFRYHGDPLTPDEIARAQHSYKHLNPGKFIIVDIKSKEVKGEFTRFIDAEVAGFGKSNRIGECLNCRNKANSLNDEYFVLPNLDAYDERLLHYLQGLQHRLDAKWINQYDLQGHFIDKYPSINSIQTKLKFKSGNSIRVCLEGLQKKAYNYIWRYSNTCGDLKISVPIKKKKIIEQAEQYDLSGNLITTYKTPKEAAKAINRSVGVISQCISGKTKTGGGYIWKYREAVL